MELSDEDLLMVSKRGYLEVMMNHHHLGLD